jgi:hypothetical protein
MAMFMGVVNIFASTHHRNETAMFGVVVNIFVATHPCAPPGRGNSEKTEEE